MNAESLLGEVYGALALHADPVRAVNEKKYQKSEREHIGVTVPQIRAVTKDFLKRHKIVSKEEMWQIFEGLWTTDIFEMKSVALIILQAFPRYIDRTDLPRIHELVVESSCWVFNDQLGCHVLGDLVAKDNAALETMDMWAKDSNLWSRRVAMQSLLKGLSRGDLSSWERFVSYAQPLLNERDFWTRKVIGWVLREVSKKNPEKVFQFLKQNEESVSGLTLREGAKYLPQESRSELGLRS